MAGNTSGELHCYTDESGNTGNNLFDIQQPIFWTATLVGKRTLSSAAAAAVDAWRARLGVSEIHAVDIRMSGVEQIAHGVRMLLIEQDCRLIFTRIDKRFHARLKLADTVLDSGNNHAVSNFHYGIRGLRLPLAHAIVESMTIQDEEAFWPAYLAQDPDGLRAVLESVRGGIDRLVKYPRNRQLLFDAFDWGITHPNALLDGAGRLDSPNVVALTMIFSGIQRMLGGGSTKVLRFVHDEQNQFATSLKTAHRLGRSFKAATKPTSLITDIARVDNIPADIEFVASTAEPALQVVDVLLWMTKRLVQNDEVPLPACERLEHEVASRSLALNFTRGALAEEVAETMKAIMSRPLSDEQLHTAEDLVQEIEAARIARRDSTPNT